MNWIHSLSPLAQFVLFSALKIICVFAVVMTSVAYSVLAERKISAFIQDPARAEPCRTLEVSGSRWPMGSKRFSRRILHRGTCAKPISGWHR